MTSKDVDSRGIRRGRCNDCPCDGYSGGEIGLKCVTCGHFPAKHENLTSPDSAAAHNPVVAPVSPRISTTANEQSFGTLGPCCRVQDCTVEAYYDLNVSRQFPLCYEHLTTLPVEIRNLYISDSNDGRCAPQVQTISHTVPMMPKPRPRSPQPPTTSIDPDVRTSSSDLDRPSVMQSLTRIFKPNAKPVARSPSPNPRAPGIPQSNPQTQLKPPRPCKLFLLRMHIAASVTIVFLLHSGASRFTVQVTRLH